MAARSKSTRDPLENLIEQALLPGTFIRDRDAFGFVAGLEKVALEVTALIKTDPARSARLHEALLAGCYVKVEETHHCHELFLFVLDLYVGWIKARQAADADPAETASKLFAWYDNDPYSLSSDLLIEAPKALDKRGAAAFEKELRRRFDEASRPQPETADGRRAGILPEFWAGALRSHYLGCKNAAAYQAFAEDTGVTTKDCLALAKLFRARGRLQEALAWVERGNPGHLSGSSESYELPILKRSLLTKLGRGSEALESAWAGYIRAPSEFSYQELMKFVPKKERSAWHKKAMDAANGRDLCDAIPLFLGAGETQRLAALLEPVDDAALEKESHSNLEPAAERLEKKYPALAARLWRAQGMRILNAAKSKYYRAALSNFAQAKACFEKAGQAPQWEKTALQIRARHQRKTGFIDGFDALVKGHAAGRPLTYLEAAKARWNRVKG